MPLLFIEYPKCTTCQRAKKWLEARGVGFQARHIVEAPPPGRNWPPGRKGCR